MAQWVFSQKIDENGYTQVQTKCFIFANQSPLVCRLLQKSCESEYAFASSVNLIPVPQADYGRCKDDLVSIYSRWPPSSCSRLGKR